MSKKQRNFLINIDSGSESEYEPSDDEKERKTKTKTKPKARSSSRKPVRRTAPKKPNNKRQQEFAKYLSRHIGGRGFVNIGKDASSYAAQFLDVESACNLFRVNKFLRGLAAAFFKWFFVTCDGDSVNHHHLRNAAALFPDIFKHSHADEMFRSWFRDSTEEALPARRVRHRRLAAIVTGSPIPDETPLGLMGSSLQLAWASRIARHVREVQRQYDTSTELRLKSEQKGDEDLLHNHQPSYHCDLCGEICGAWPLQLYCITDNADHSRRDVAMSLWRHDFTEERAEDRFVEMDFIKNAGLILCAGCSPMNRAKYQTPIDTSVLYGFRNIENGFVNFAEWHHFLPLFGDNLVLKRDLDLLWFDHENEWYTPKAVLQKLRIPQLSGSSVQDANRALDASPQMAQFRRELATLPLKLQAKYKFKYKVVVDLA